MRYADIANPRKHRLLDSIIGCPSDDAHHINHKGIGGRGEKAGDDADDATPLCRDLHALHHDSGGITFSRNNAGNLTFVANEKASEWLRRRGVRCHAGQVHTALYEGRTYDDAPDTPLTGSDDAPDLTAEAAFLAEYRASDGYNWRLAAENMALARDKWQATGKGWRTRFRDWARECEVSDSERSRMLKVADTLPFSEETHLTAQKQRQLADAVVAGVEYAEALNAALTLSASDFAAEYLAREPKPPRRLVCPECGFRDVAAEFKEAGE